MTQPARRVAGILGGARALGKSIATPLQMRRAVRSGLPFAALEALTGALGVGQASMISILGISPRTLARRKREKVLTPVESDRLYRIAYLTTLAAETLGSEEKAGAWLRRPNRALGGERPIELLDTEIGERQVEEVLTRLAHGVYS